MFLAQIANTPQLPELPEGPSLDRVRGPVEIPAYESWQIALAVLLIVLLLGIVTWVIVRIRKQAKAITIPPYQAAIAELEAASKRTDQDDEQFAVLCSQALRRYLENGIGLKFTARTSEEFLRSLKGNTSLNESYQNELANTLAAFDRIKFAGGEINEEGRSKISDTVRNLIDRAHETTQAKGGKE
jgi:hypothetical protein